ncbi:MAG: hypothetical protein F6K39_07875 [Okeania sp. SIO3B3]|nr:hypothetical protein [Okeania sp. SIO3B3]
MLETFPDYLLYLEVSRYFLKLSDRLLSSLDFLRVFGADENFTPIYRYLKTFQRLLSDICFSYREVDIC